MLPNSANSIAVYYFVRLALQGLLFRTARCTLHTQPARLVTLLERLLLDHSLTAKLNYIVTCNSKIGPIFVQSNLGVLEAEHCHALVIALNIFA